MVIVREHRLCITMYNIRTVMAQTQGRMKVLENQELKHRTREFNSKIFGE